MNNTIKLQQQIIELKLKLQLRDTDIKHLENDLNTYKQWDREKELQIKLKDSDIKHLNKEIEIHKETIDYLNEKFDKLIKLTKKED